MLSALLFCFLVFVAPASPHAVVQDDLALEAAREIGRLASEGRVLRGEERIDDAIVSFERALAIAQEIEDLNSVAVLYSQIALCHAAADRHELELDYYRKVREQVVGRDPEVPFVAVVGARVCHDIALVLLLLGRVEEAVESAREGVRRLEHVQDPEVRAMVLDTLGHTLRAAGRLAEAPAYFRRAARELEHLDPAEQPRADVLCNLAESLGELGDKDGAFEIVNVTIAAIEGRTSVDALVAGRAYRVRGVLHWYRSWPDAEGDLARARDYLDAAGLAPDSLERILGDLYLAFTLRNLGRPDRSAAMEREILELLVPQVGELHSLTLATRKFLAGSLWDLADQTGDRELLDEARRIYEVTAEQVHAVRAADAFTVYASLGSLLLDRFDDPQAAEPWLRSAIEEIESAATLARTVDEADRSALFRQRRLNKRHDPYEGLLRCLLRLDRPEEALGILELSRARGLADLLARSRFDASSEALERALEVGDEAAAARLRALPGEIDAALAAAALAGRAGADDPAARERRVEANRRLRALSAERAELTRHVTEVVRPVDVSVIRRALRGDEALLAYFFGRSGSFACLAEGPAGEVRWIELREEDGSPLSAEKVAEDTRAVLAAISAPVAPARGVPIGGSRELGADVAHALFERLVPAPLWESLRERRLVHLLPHGALHLLPFEALVVSPGADAARTRYWIDEGPALAYQESGSALVWSLGRRAEQRAEPGAGVGLIVAAPAYEGFAAEPLPTGSDASAPRVKRVARDGAAARAGLLAGDVLSSYAGRALTDPADLEPLWREAQAADAASPLELRVLRAGGERRLRIEPGDPGLELFSPSEPFEPVRSEGDVALEPLPGAAREAEAVRTALENRTDGARVRMLLGSDATETLLSAWAPRASILHVAAHQIPDPDGRWEAGRLALTPPPYPTAEDDGFVDLDDLLLHWRRRLERCELVVLASCRSRIGRLEADEGLYALPLGLRFAGCPAVVASLWPVDDAATAELMGSFYATLGEDPGGSRLEAFNAARRALRAERAHPHAWAPFVWTGAPR